MKKIKISRIIGFIIATLFLLFFAMMMLGEEWSSIKVFELPRELIIPIILWFICAIALGFSFKYPQLCGWTLIAAGLIWFIYMIITVGFDDIGIALFFGLVLGVPGVLFLPWIRKK